MSTYDPAADPVHGSGWNSAARWGGWVWNAPRGSEHFRRCSFCGSIHPEDLAAEAAGTGCGHADCPEPRNGLARCHFPPPLPLQPENGEHRFANTGWRASWADQKYGWPHKFYVEGLTNRHAEVLRIITALRPGQEDRMKQETGYQWYPVGEIPEGTDVSGWRLEDGHYTHVGLGSDKTHFAKFYTIHLADPRISQDVKDAIQRVSGLKLTFADDGTVSWQRWEAAG